MLILKVIQDANGSQHSQDACSDLLSDSAPVIAAAEQWLHTNGFPSAAQNFNQLSEKPTSPPNPC